MANERVSPTQRVRLQSVAEREVLRYKGDHMRWHKHVHNVELDAMQLLKMELMDRHDQTIDNSCRRTGKTTTKELWCLKFLATHQDQEEGIVAPREAQAQVNLNYHLDSIRRSPILDAYLMHDRGRKQFSDTRYQFMNRSIARSYGIMAQVDGGDLTLASLEEVDDMPADRLYGRFLLMLGASRRLGASKDSVNKPQVRITGVYKGADTLDNMIRSGTYSLLPVIDVYLGMEMGILNEAFMLEMRGQLSPQEYIRQLLCKNVTAKNVIWEKWVQWASQLGLTISAQIEAPVPGGRYRKRGPLAFGYDHLGHGEDPNSSRSALVVIEELTGFDVVLFAYSWPAGADETKIKNDLKAFWRYFDPSYAIGDAYGIGMLTALNDELYSENLTQIDRRTIGDGESTATTWREWAFAPMRFDGVVKHQMAQAVRTSYQNRRAVLPYVDDKAQTEDEAPELTAMRDLKRQLPNIIAEATSKQYSSYKRADKKIGDDLFDAYMAAKHALATRGSGVYATVVTSRQQSIADLLSAQSAIPMEMS